MNKNIADRLTFLAETFNVFEGDDVEGKVDELKESGYESSIINGTSDNVIALISSKLNDKGRMLKKVSISSDVFSSMIVADPSENKMYLQWMLNLFSRFTKEGKVHSLETAIRFVEEDLPQANEYLMIFEGNKRKKKFKELCQGSYILKGISDPTDINQYTSLPQLFDAVDPFIEKEPSAVERMLMRYVDAGQAEIPVRDRKYTLYVPKTLAASVVFDKFANWCTVKEKNGMFKSYTENHRTPFNTKSNIFIIINNDFFTGESEELYQIHFETKQVKDRKNGENVHIFDGVLNESIGLFNYFHEKLLSLAKAHKKGIDSNIYLDYLIEFGVADSIFEIYDENALSMKITTKKISRLPDISRFKLMEQIIILDAGLVEIHESIGDLTKLRMLSVPNNRIKSLPSTIGNLQNLWFINLKGNNVTEFPEEIKYLDKTNGGSLDRIALEISEIGEKNYIRLKELLPTTILG